jgi:putative ABC transport system permease protein
MAGALLMTRYVRSLLFEIQPSDPVTLCGVAGLMIAVSVLACYWPARRAMMVDPARMLRQE